ncbi:hypothetical protein BC828DRAFT_375317 [Blastocladiella britannica]|nr:hypothetical protein BC828DRAFT_375317 [Blastocladiella britannica]
MLTPDDGLEMLHVVLQVEVPSFVPAFLDRVFQVYGAETTEHVARLGRLDLLLQFQRFQIETLPESVREGACEGGHVHILEWNETHLSDRIRPISNKVFEHYLWLASSKGHHAILDWLMAKIKVTAAPVKDDFRRNALPNHKDADYASDKGDKDDHTTEAYDPRVFMVSGSEGDRFDIIKPGGKVRVGAEIGNLCIREATARADLATVDWWLT